MLDELLDIFDRDRRQGGAQAGERRGLRGLFARMVHGEGEDERRQHRQASSRRYADDDYDDERQRRYERERYTFDPW